MKLTKKEEIEVVKVYDIWLNSYLNGDVKTYDSYLDDEYHFIGSTNNEEFLTRKAATTFFKVTADQLAGRTDLRNTIRTIEYFDGLVFITELFDAWFMMGDNWTYYGRFRFTSALRNKNQGWRFIYQHFSMPDSKAQDGETLGAEQVSKENQELRDAIKRRTKELEQKNRELEIEAALERVRTRTMAMQISNELKDAAALLFQQAKALGVPAYSCGYNIWGEDEKSFTSWMSTQDGSDFNAVLNIPLTEDANFIRFDESRKKGEQFFVLELGGKRMQEHYKYLKTIPAFKAYFDYAVSVGFDLPAAQIHHIANFSKGNLMFITLEPCPEFHNVFKRFAAVFDQAYTRFLDLQKAEAQAREAEIQLALERVRSRSLAMHHTSELQEVVNIVAQQLQSMGMETSGGVVIIINNEVEEDLPVWASSGAADYMQKVVVPSFDRPIFTDLRDAIKQGIGFFSGEYSQEEKIEFFEHLFRYNPWSSTPGEWKKNLFSRVGGLTRLAAISRHTSIAVTSHYGKKFSTNEKEILKRFTSVFEQSYIRFLDLQKAEAQAREAQIEAALERVRGKAMAMHHSDELSDVLSILFEQFDILGIRPVDAHLDLFNWEKNTFTYRATGKEGKRVIAEQIVDLDSRPEWKALADKWKKSKPKSIDLSFYPKQVIGELMKFFPDIWAAMPADAIMDPDDFPDGMFDTLGYHKFGYLGFHHYRKATEEETNILLRFASEFERLYQRFLDLQKAEAQAREAMIEAALERVRSSSLAMYKTDDLGDVVSVLFQQMQGLSVDMGFASVSIFIFEKDSRDIVQWIQLPDGVVSLRIPYFEHPILSDLLSAKENGADYFSKVYTVEEKNSWAERGFELTDYKNAPTAFKISLMAAPGYAMAIALENHSGICIPSFVGRLPSAENVGIMKRTSKVFDQAYTRFLDLQKAEALAEQARLDLIQIQTEKQRAEKALHELQATQKQLIQSEKMASLGELTAGIAHEIQNPLNFVNNFSEVSNELISEMNTALDKGDINEAKAIANDVQHNLEKINHHGQRAADIVKGMLQHSRSSSGIKEPTDINALCDEYLRLSYHGMRAKDKNFNATIKTDFDNSIGNINIIPQDIGRLVLNLINNAFYAVGERSKAGSPDQSIGAVYEKKKQNIPGYEQTVQIKTTQNSPSGNQAKGGLGTKFGGAEVVIKVSDNGPGIPQKILDKIFQPFFTTKPTGQGTGLGLSLSYDIVKAHGGELKVETKEGEGSTFIILLPVNNN